ncbi:hypothetical protein RN001_014828 [Aquatica leii]|uniref:Rac GTPase-activating protein 1 n=1 Tax=Aquatica leii TaxID=1421715 RepID=A0AAN7NYH3_9COLE|nr:hypothetical protein RN001_014828 [Aquatica leii]
MSKKYVKTPKILNYGTPGRQLSDSEESTASSVSEAGSTGSNDNLSLVAEYDELMKCAKSLRHDEVEDAFLCFIKQTGSMVAQFCTVQQECKRLQDSLAKTMNDYSELECKMSHARKLLDQERKRSRMFEAERDELDRQMKRIALVVHKNQNRPDQTVKELSFLNENYFVAEGNCMSPQLSAIPEVNTTGSLLSDFSYSRSEDDLDVSLLPSRMSGAISKKRHSDVASQSATKKRRSDNKIVEINATDTVRATTTLTLNKDGPITATSIIESIPVDVAQPSAPPAHLLINNKHPCQNSTAVRQHCFQSKTLVMPETCGPCNKRMRFGRTVVKCKECRAICHPECKNLLPLPCTPLVNTPLRGAGLISDYTPTTSPMVPALIVHCTKEVELRGCKEIGIYRIPGSEKDVKALKERFLRGKTVPCINQVDVHVICGAVKDFLRSLQEPIVTVARWHDFVKAVEVTDKTERTSLLNQIIAELPQPNRDTLSYMILHLKRIADMPECKMPIDNLAKVFAPTIVGYSTTDLNRSRLLEETRLQGMIMQNLINLPTDYWQSFLETNDIYRTPCSRLQQTPSTDSLLYPKSRGMFSPYSVKSTVKKKQKFFPTP